jgi:C4-dicarboxylate-specific signal transduction histidine kinase
MSSTRPFLWSKPPVIRSYGIAGLSVIAVAIISLWPSFHLETAPASLFLCAILFGAWFGGGGPGLLATTISATLFYYYFLPPVHTFAAKPEEIPRFVVFFVAALFVWTLSAAQNSATESLKRARDDLKATVQELQTTNEALHEESLERKHAEEDLRQAHADLSRVSRVTTMGELTASLAHEVNQPIAAAVTNANTCLRWLTRDHPDLEEARAAAMRIVKDGTRAAEIIQRVRLLFQKGTPQRELVDVNEVIRGMIVVFGSEATRYNVSIRTGLAPDLPEVMADRVQLQQVLMNLMMNAIDAMKDVDGTRELEIKSVRTEDKQLLLSISDTGAGLPPQQADQIFNAFFTTKAHGTGMGLRISRSIVESHGGRLWAGGNSPRGASFYVSLPTKVEEHELP